MKETLSDDYVRNAYPTIEKIANGLYTKANEHATKLVFVLGLYVVITNKMPPETGAWLLAEALRQSYLMARSYTVAEEISKTNT